VNRRQIGLSAVAFSNHDRRGQLSRAAVRANEKRLAPARAGLAREIRVPLVYPERAAGDHFP